MLLRLVYREYGRLVYAVAGTCSARRSWPRRPPSRPSSRPGDPRQRSNPVAIWPPGWRPSPAARRSTSTGRNPRETAGNLEDVPVAHPAIVQQPAGDRAHVRRLAGPTGVGRTSAGRAGGRAAAASGGAHPDRGRGAAQPTGRDREVAGTPGAQETRGDSDTCERASIDALTGRRRPRTGSAAITPNTVRAQQQNVSSNTRIEEVSSDGTGE